MRSKRIDSKERDRIIQMHNLGYSRQAICHAIKAEFGSFLTPTQVAGRIGMWKKEDSDVSFRPIGRTGHGHG